jgi:hypothetical protein
MVLRFGLILRFGLDLPQQNFIRAPKKALGGPGMGCHGGLEKPKRVPHGAWERAPKGPPGAWKGAPKGTQRAQKRENNIVIHINSYPNALYLNIASSRLGITKQERKHFLTCSNITNCSNRPPQLNVQKTISEITLSPNS